MLKLKMMMLWKEKKKPVLLIDPNRKRFLTVNSFDDKKMKRETNSFFFFKKHLKTHSQTLFSTFLSVPERKNCRKPTTVKNRLNSFHEMSGDTVDVRFF